MEDITHVHQTTCKLCEGCKARQAELEKQLEDLKVDIADSRSEAIDAWAPLVGPIRAGVAK